MKKNILFISYDSICDPISNSQKVSPLLKYFKKNNLNICLISFEKKKDYRSKRIKIIEKKFKELHINWIKLPFYNNFFLRLAIFLFSQLLLIYVIFFYKIKIIHAWSYIPMMLLIIPNFFLRRRVVFDIRGFWFDEKRDFDQINQISYYVLKKIEKILFKSAYKIITLTKKSINIISKNFDIQKKNIYFVTTFTNKKNYKISLIKNEKNYNFLYLGSAKNSYDFNKVLDFMKIFNEYFKNWRFSAFSSHKNFILKKIHGSNLNKNKFKVSTISIDKVKSNISNYNFAIYFIKPTFAKKASCPTKLGEILFSGIPIITNYGVGDIDMFEKKSNIVLFNFNKINEKEISKKIANIVKLKKNPQIQKQRLFADKFFDEEIYVNKILKIYKNI